MYFYGTKLHCVGIAQEGSIPVPFFLGLAPASTSDIKAFEQIVPEIGDTDLYADLAYIGAALKAILESQGVNIFTPIKKTKDLFSFTGGETYSTWVSSIRQPIESLFNWLQEKTKIQNASKVRSSSGLLVHVFGRIAAALLIFLQTSFNL